MDLVKIHLPLVVRAVREARESHAMMKEHLLGLQKTDRLTKAAFNEAAKAISGGVYSTIIDSKAEVRDRITRAMLREVSGESEAAAKRALDTLGDDLKFSDKSIRQLQAKQRSILRLPDKAGIINSEVDTAISRLTDSTGVAGLSLFRQSRRLVIAELNRYAQRFAMLTLKELGFTKYGWDLSSQHYAVMKRYGLKHEVCEVHAKQTFTFARLWKTMPPHPCCMCSPRGIK